MHQRVCHDVVPAEDVRMRSMKERSRRKNEEEEEEEEEEAEE